MQPLFNVTIRTAGTRMEVVIERPMTKPEYDLLCDIVASLCDFVVKETPAQEPA